MSMSMPIKSAKARGSKIGVSPPQGMLTRQPVYTTIDQVAGAKDRDPADPARPAQFPTLANLESVTYSLGRHPLRIGLQGNRRALEVNQKAIDTGLDRAGDHLPHYRKSEGNDSTMYLFSVAQRTEDRHGGICSNA
jgi:hypothetical protein